MDGIINLYKSENMTSNDAVIRLRRLLGVKKIGHTGTLDPNATGVLPMCIGKATRLIEYMENASKTYICKCVFGKTSDTLDIWGDVTDADLGEIAKLAELSDEKIRNTFSGIFSKFLGEILQIPPKISAKWVNGRRAYDLARDGIDFELEAKIVSIFDIEFLAFDKKSNELEFKVVCSKGTYIRSLCRDIAEQFSSSAVMTKLTRIETSGLSIDTAIPFEKLETLSLDEIERLLLPKEFAVSSLDKVQIPNADRKKAFFNGLSFYLRKDIFSPEKPFENKIYAVLDGNNLLGTAKITEEEDRFVFIPEKVIPE